MSCRTLEMVEMPDLLDSLVEPARQGDRSAADRLFSEAGPYLLRLRFLDRFKPLAQRRQNLPTEVTEARMTISRLMQGLTERQRQVVALYHIGGLAADLRSGRCGYGRSAL